MSKDNGGPAFPENWNGQQVSGMTLRDYFAAKALAGLAANPSMISARDSGAISYVVGAAYAVADAMILERAQ